MTVRGWTIFYGERQNVLHTILVPKQKTNIYDEKGILVRNKNVLGL